MLIATIRADGTGAYDAFGRLAGATVDDGGVEQVWTRGASSGLLQAQSVNIVGAANPTVYNVSGMTWRGTQLVGYTDTVAQRTHRFWYSQTGRLVSAQAKDSVTAGQVGLTCVGFGTSKQYVPGPSFGNIEVVREGNAAPVTSTYGYTDGNIDLDPAGPDAPTAVGTTSLTYDLFGRVVTKGGGETFGYDLAGRLVAVSRSAGPSETIEYDPFGLPVRRTVNGQVIWYLGRQATVTGIGGALKADVHVEVNGQRVASVRVGATPRTLFLHRDRLTSVVATTLAGRVAGASYRYTPHGAVEAASGDAGDSTSELGYAGALRLSGGLLWMGARVYDPALKIFLQPDPLAPHTYAYADGDPINKWDPTGLQAYCGELIRCPSDDDRIKVKGPLWRDREQVRPPPVVTGGEFLDGTEAPTPGLPVNTGPFPSSTSTHFAPGATSDANRGTGSGAGSLIVAVSVGAVAMAVVSGRGGPGLLRAFAPAASNGLQSTLAGLRTADSPRLLGSYLSLAVSIGVNVLLGSTPMGLAAKFVIGAAVNFASTLVYELSRDGDIDVGHALYAASVNGVLGGAASLVSPMLLTRFGPSWSNAIGWAAGLAGNIAANIATSPRRRQRRTSRRSSISSRNSMPLLLSPVPA